MRRVPLRLTDRSRGNRLGREEADLLVSSNSSILDPRSSTFFLNAAVSSLVSLLSEQCKDSIQLLVNHDKPLILGVRKD